MSSSDFVFDGFRQIDDSIKKPQNFKNFNENNTESPPTPTYYANSEIFSRRSPRKYPKEVGKLCKNVFEDKSFDR